MEPNADSYADSVTGRTSSSSSSHENLLERGQGEQDVDRASTSSSHSSVHSNEERNAGAPRPRDGSPPPLPPHSPRPAATPAPAPRLPLHLLQTVSSGAKRKPPLPQHQPRPMAEPPTPVARRTRSHHPALGPRLPYYRNEEEGTRKRVLARIDEEEEEEGSPAARRRRLNDGARRSRSPARARGVDRNANGPHRRDAPPPPRVRRRDSPRPQQRGDQEQDPHGAHGRRLGRRQEQRQEEEEVPERGPGLIDNLLDHFDYDVNMDDIGERMEIPRGGRWRDANADYAFLESDDEEDEAEFLARVERQRAQGPAEPRVNDAPARQNDAAALAALVPVDFNAHNADRDAHVVVPNPNPRPVLVAHRRHSTGGRMEAHGVQQAGGAVGARALVGAGHEVAEHDPARAGLARRDEALLPHVVREAGNVAAGNNGEIVQNPLVPNPIDPLIPMLGRFDADPLPNGPLIAANDAPPAAIAQEELPGDGDMAAREAAQREAAAEAEAMLTALEPGYGQGYGGPQMRVRREGDGDGEGEEQDEEEEDNDDVQILYDGPPLRGLPDVALPAIPPGPEVPPIPPHGGLLPPLALPGLAAAIPQAPPLLPGVLQQGVLQRARPYRVPPHRRLTPAQALAGLIKDDDTAATIFTNRPDLRLHGRALLRESNPADSHLPVSLMGGFVKGVFVTTERLDEGEMRELKSKISSMHGLRRADMISCGPKDDGLYRALIRCETDGHAVQLVTDGFQLSKKTLKCTFPPEALPEHVIRSGNYPFYTMTVSVMNWLSRGGVERLIVALGGRPTSVEVTRTVQASFDKFEDLLRALETLNAIITGGTQLCVLQ